MEATIRIRVFSLCILIFFLGLDLLGQTNISGLVNDYQEVVAIDPLANSITVNSAAAFSPGDTVLLIQMKGATINTSNSAAFGDVTNYGSSGLYELNVIQSIAANELVFDFVFTNTYSTSGLVQVVRVPHYTTANLTGNVQAASWNGSTGGVAAVIVDGTLNLNGNSILANGSGFRGGQSTTVASGCNFFTAHTAYRYDSGNWRSAPKGEGIAEFVEGAEWGRGAQANGGGGGNDHNAAGGGGGNLAAGGQGGENQEPRIFGCQGPYPGRGGKAQTGSTSRLFLGGGGGAGNNNNALADGDGGEGGGLVLVIADSIEGNGGAIRANGTIGGESENDGSGGGGAGGTIFIEGSLGTTALSITAQGGDGGDARNILDRCYGPGGGGSGGAIYYSLGSFPGNVSSSTAPGLAGITYNSTEPCNGSNLNAADGQAGNSIPNSQPVFSQTPFGTPVPVELLYFITNCNEGVVSFEWATATEINADYFEIEYSTDLSTWESIARIPASGMSKSLKTYHYTMALEPGFVRLRQTDYDGSFDVFQVREVQCFQESFDFTVYPNPAISTATIDLNAYEKGCNWQLIDLQGAVLKSGSIAPQSNSTEVPLEGLSRGIYLIRVEQGGHKLLKKLMVQ